MHKAGELGQSDFTRMGGLGITVGGQPFDHLVFHFVLTYSNWESGTVCYGESYESRCITFARWVRETWRIDAIWGTVRVSRSTHASRAAVCSAKDAASLIRSTPLKRTTLLRRLGI